MLLLRHNGTVYGHLDGTRFQATVALDQLDPASHLSRTLRAVAETACEVHEQLGVSIVEAYVPRQHAHN